MEVHATVPLHVTAIAPRYILFEAPLLISAPPRALKITLAASGPATFTIAGERYAVGSRPRTTTVRIRRGHSLLRLACSLRSPGAVIKSTYVALRGR